MSNLSRLGKMAEICQDQRVLLYVRCENHCTDEYLRFEHGKKCKLFPFFHAEVWSDLDSNPVQVSATVCSVVILVSVFLLFCFSSVK